VSGLNHVGLASDGGLVEFAGTAAPGMPPEAVQAMQGPGCVAAGQRVAACVMVQPLGWPRTPAPWDCLDWAAPVIKDDSTPCQKE